MANPLDDSIATGCHLMIHYGGYTREIDAREYKTGKDGQPQVLCWQHSGGSQHEIPGWRRFNLAEVSAVSYAPGQDPNEHGAAQGTIAKVLDVVKLL